MNLAYWAEAWTCQVSQRPRFSASPPFSKRPMARPHFSFSELNLQTHSGVAQRTGSLENELGSLHMFWLAKRILTVSKATQCSDVLSHDPFLQNYLQETSQNRKKKVHLSVIYKHKKLKVISMSKSREMVRYVINLQNNVTLLLKTLSRRCRELYMSIISQ